MREHEEFLTATEVAALFRVNPGTVRKWRVRGLIGARRTPGGQWRYAVGEVAGFLGVTVNHSEVTVNHEETGQ